MSDQPELDFTGERFTPECEREIAYEHWHRYAWAAQMVAGKRVLDAACGEGYGSHMLSCHAAHVTGIDLGEEAIRHARQRYRAANLVFTTGDCTQLPFEDDSFDVVVSFETLEHLAAQDRLLAEFRRVLNDDGLVVLSSPDRHAYSDQTGYDNPFHVRELYRDELEALLDRHFEHWRLLGQKLMFLSAIWSGEADGASQWLTLEDGCLYADAAPRPGPLYFIAVAAVREHRLPQLPMASLYSDRGESVYAHYNDVVRKHILAEQELAACRERLARLESRSAPWWKRLFSRS